jgi:hypothetical protein
LGVPGGHIGLVEADCRVGEVNFGVDHEIRSGGEGEIRSGGEGKDTAIPGVGLTRPWNRPGAP